MELKSSKRKSFFENVFLIPFRGKQFIVYLPIHGILFKGNAGVINIFYNALNGDTNAQSRFGLSSGQVANICQAEKRKSLRLEEKPFQPTTVSLFLTTNCSLKCKYCYANAGESNKQIKKEYIEAAVSEVIKNALISDKKLITVNYHGGGDIGVAWDLVEQTTQYTLNEAKKASIGVRINAGINGILTDAQRKWTVKNIDSATVSLDGDENIQNVLRPLRNGKPSFELVHNTIKYFEEHNFNYAIRTTITQDTVRQLERIITFFCKNYKVHKIKIEPVFVQERASKNHIYAPSANDFVKYFLKARRIAELYNRELLYSGARFNSLTDIFCQAAGSSFGVTPEGYITSCYEVLEKNNPLSDTFFYGKIEDGKIVLSKDRLNKLARLTVYEKKKCQRCFAKFHCAGDCPAKSIYSEKEQTDHNYRCIINRELTKDQLLRSIV